MWNKLNDDLRNEVKLERFKRGLRSWVLQNIPIKPIQKFQRFGERCRPRDVTPPGLGEQLDIRRFLISRSTSNGPRYNGRNLSSPASPPVEAPPQPTDRPPPSATLSQSRRQGILKYFRPDDLKDF